MEVKPILFNTEMVRAIWEGRKTVTRRLMKTNKRGKLIKPYEEGDVLWVRETWGFQPCSTCVFRDSDCGEEPAEIQTFREDIVGCFLYRADYEEEDAGQKLWRPSIHMPLKAARIFLRVTSVSAGNLRESIDDAGLPMRELAEEGIPIYEECMNCIGRGREDGGCLICGNYDQPRWEFSRLWGGTIRKDRRAAEGWEANPRVWVVRFERTAKPEGWPK